jgi:hypothetical protein
MEVVQLFHKRTYCKISICSMEGEMGYGIKCNGDCILKLNMGENVI